jgi:mRNA interferase HigB
LVRIIARRTLREFLGSRGTGKDRAALKAAVDAWFHEVRKARWSNSAELKRHYATASVLSSDRVVFNLKGNDYRLIVAIDFQRGIVWIKWLGTHAEYDRIDARTIEHAKH